MRQVEHQRAAQEASSVAAAARRLRLVQAVEASTAPREESDHLEIKLDYDELARALLRHVLRCLQTS